MDRFIKRASNLLGLSPSKQIKHSLVTEDSEVVSVVYSKNNVCVHPPSSQRRDPSDAHRPGYLTIYSCYVPETSGNSLILTWIPNTTLQLNPLSIHIATSAINERSPSSHSRRSSRGSTCSSFLKRRGSTNSDDVPITNKPARDTDSLSFAFHDSLSLCQQQDNNSDHVIDLGCDIMGQGHLENGAGDMVREANSETSSQCASSPHRSSDVVSMCSFLELSPESFAQRHNLVFHESEKMSLSQFEPVVSASGIFSVDLGLMRSLRLFFSNRECTCGQLVVASRESQYKIFHFHYGGLGKLAQLFAEWKPLFQPPEETTSQVTESSMRHFMVCLPDLTDADLHPEEGLPEIVGPRLMLYLTDDEGRILHENVVRRSIFLNGVEPDYRTYIWPFLFNCYPFNSTHEERENVKEETQKKYLQLSQQRAEMSESEYIHFWRTIQCTIEKDVVRTDRNNPFYAGEKNPNVQKMKTILLNYAILHPNPGYTQGMSDLLAPILVEIENESEAFWCFEGLMRRNSIFISTPTDGDMDKHLMYLRELIRLMSPNFYHHLQNHTGGMELLFCHRWILLCFKREFSLCDVLPMWECCWSKYQTEYFHLFICLSIVCIYGDDVVAMRMGGDEMLLHFSSLANHMDGKVVLSKARGLVHQFRQLSCISCIVSGLCQMCGPGMWDSGHVPVVECVGHEPDEACPYIPPGQVET